MNYPSNVEEIIKLYKIELNKEMQVLSNSQLEFDFHKFWKKLKIGEYFVVTINPRFSAIVQKTDLFSGLVYTPDYKGYAFYKTQPIKSFLSLLWHREDGPAIQMLNGKWEWYLDGDRVNPMVVFEKLSDERKAEVIWELDKWK